MSSDTLPSRPVQSPPPLRLCASTPRNPHGRRCTDESDALFPLAIDQFLNFLLSLSSHHRHPHSLRLSLIRPIHSDENTATCSPSYLDSATLIRFAYLFSIPRAFRRPTQPYRALFSLRCAAFIDSLVPADSSTKRTKKDEEKKNKTFY